MTAIGIDFGTTNSVVSYFENDEPRLFTTRGRAEIRSAIAWSRNSEKPLIGRAAFLKRGLTGISLTDRFKLAIGREEASNLAAKSFLKTLLDTFVRERAVRDVSSVVLTVPDVWVRNEGQIPYRKLVEICGDLGIPLRKVLSEPVAAASYFAYLQSKSGRPFEGHALIYDHGGGTLDLSLVHVAGKEISTIDGIGIADKSGGIGGLHYDQAVADHCSARTAAEREIIESDRSRWLDDFESSKIECADEVEDAVASYLRSGKSADFDEVVFEVSGVPVSASDLSRVFEARFSDRIESSLDEIMARHESSIDFRNPESFRIVPVGGFSSFCLIQWLLEKKFDRKELAGLFDNGIPPDEAPFAISKGACVYSAEETSVFETCPVGISVRVIDGLGRKERLPILQRGTGLNVVREPAFAKTEILAGNRAELRTVPISFTISGSSGTVEFNTALPGADILPEFMTAHGWRVGARVDDDLVAHVVFETNDRNRIRRSVALGEIVSMAQDAVAVKHDE